MISEEYINNAIEKTLRGESNLTEDVLAIRGFSNGNIRRLINNLTNTECTYLEAGVLMGGTFVSSFNEKCTSIGFEDFSQNFQVDFPGYSKEELEENIERNRDIAKEIYIHYTCFMDSDKNNLPKGIDIFLMDAEHGLQNQSIALPEAFDNMADTFVYITDDASWKEVSEGTGVGFKILRNKMHLVKKWELRGVNEKDDTWVCGVDIYLIKKK